MLQLGTLPLEAPAVMGVLNVTPDSFSDGGRYAAAEAAIRHALRMIDEGAAIVDVGGESTRPGAAEVTEQDPATDEVQEFGSGRQERHAEQLLASVQELKRTGALPPSTTCEAPCSIA